MRYLCIFALILGLLLSSCEKDMTPIDIFKNTPKELPRLVSYTLRDNKRVELEFNETVLLSETLYKGVKERPGIMNSHFILELSTPLNMGESEYFHLSAKNENGSTARISLRLIGRNTNIASVLLNEISTAGTNSSPDRIELICTKEGNTAGIILSSGYINSPGYSFILPDIEVKKNDIILIYWDKETKEEKRELSDGNTAYYLNAKATKTLLSTKGIIVLESEYQGAVMDAFVYTDDYSSDWEGLGSEKLYEDYKLLKESGAWSGSAADSSKITSSRVFSRLPGAVDTDSLDDWFITKARTSTFGEMNIYTPYVEE